MRQASHAQCARCAERLPSAARTADGQLRSVGAWTKITVMTEPLPNPPPPVAQTPGWWLLALVGSVAASAVAWWLLAAPVQEALAPPPTSGALPDVMSTAPAAAAPVTAPPIGDRPAANFPAGAAWQAGELRGQVWQPERQGTAWLIASPDAGQDPGQLLPLVRNLWSHRDIGAVILAAAPTATDQDRAAQRASAAARWIAALDAVTQDGRPAVLLGVGRAAEAALMVGADPRVLAVAALDPRATESGFDDRSWVAAVAPKWVWLGGPEQAGQAVDELSRGLPHSRTVARGQGTGAQWLAVLDQRAQLAGFLQSILGPGR